mmetsp:Transcript_44050/g.141575  ORF Transcript_44050/g.141575 Transcript_44050/m.141575 type:complete len:330 (+) Transcript_44050:1384-2373(+)
MVATVTSTSACETARTCSTRSRSSAAASQPAQADAGWPCSVRTSRTASSRLPWSTQSEARARTPLAAKRASSGPRLIPASCRARATEPARAWPHMPPPSGTRVACWPAYCTRTKRSCSCCSVAGALGLEASAFDISERRSSSSLAATSARARRCTPPEEAGEGRGPSTGRRAAESWRTACDVLLYELSCARTRVSTSTSSSSCLRAERYASLSASTACSCASRAITLSCATAVSNFSRACASRRAAACCSCVECSALSCCSCAECASAAAACSSRNRSTSCASIAALASSTAAALAASCRRISSTSLAASASSWHCSACCSRDASASRD